MTLLAVEVSVVVWEADLAIVRYISVIEEKWFFISR